MRAASLCHGVLGGLLSAPVLACTCISGDPPSAFNDATAVLVATMLDGTEQLSVEENGSQQPIEAGQVRFAVEERFKGAVGHEVTVDVASNRNTSCGPYGLRRGERYLLYVHAAAGDSKLYSGPCSRTRPLDSDGAREDLLFLRNLPPAGSGGTIRGSVSENRRWQGHEPFPGISVQIKGSKGPPLTVVTDALGRFEAKGVRPGRYLVVPQYPANYRGERESAAVTIDDLGADDVGFEAFLDGRLLGRIVDPRGQPYNHLMPKLLPTGLIDQTFASPAYGSSTDDKGGFQVPGVPPGRYLLYLEFRNVGGGQWRRFFYPGTFDPSQATLIDLGLAETKQGLEFRLPADFRVRSISGRITWPDGKPAAGAVVSLRCQQSEASGGPVLEIFAPEASADDDGRFSLDAIVGETYVLEAYGFAGPSAVGLLESMMHAPRIRIPAGEGALTHDLVLSKRRIGSGCAL